MTNIDRLKHLSEIGTVIICPKMTLLAGDHAPPVVVGEGEITVLNATSFGYSLRGIPADIAHALRSLQRINADRYDGLLRQRLTVTTSEGLRVMGGWTIPKFHVPEGGNPWVFTGEIDSLSFHEDGTFVPETKVAYLLPSQHRARIILRRFFPKPVGEQISEMRLKVLDSEVVFTLDDSNGLLLIRAAASKALPPTYTENWLGEPLRIMFGQLIYPRFVSRQSETWSMAWVRPSPSWFGDSKACALWQGDNELIDKEGFWETYRRLLTYIATARDAEGNCNFEANKITELYVEVILAARGSRWVWALTYASAVEGAVKLLGLVGRSRADIDEAAYAKLSKEVTDFKSYIDKWLGDSELKMRAKDAAARMLKTTTIQSLRQLKSEGLITTDQFDAWDKLRNLVMHGDLVSPYSSAEDDHLLLNLSQLLHALTRRLLAGVNLDRNCLIKARPV